MSQSITRTIARHIADKLRSDGFDVLIPYNSDFSVNTGFWHLKYRVTVNEHMVIVWRIVGAGGRETTKVVWSRPLSDPALFDDIFEFFNGRRKIETAAQPFIEEA